jgi:hypothetical protein
VSEYNTNWDDVPHTHKDAIPKKMRQVKNVLAVHIQEGTFRDSQLTDCYFEVANNEASVDTFDGKRRIEVKVLWFGRKPKTTWAHITLNGKWELKPNYSGEVVENIEV